MLAPTYSSTKESMPRASVFLKAEGTENENDLFSIFFQPSCFGAAAPRRIATPKMKTIVAMRIRLHFRSDCGSMYGELSVRLVSRYPRIGFQTSSISPLRKRESPDLHDAALIINRNEPPVSEDVGAIPVYSRASPPTCAATCRNPVDSFSTSAD